MKLTKEIIRLFKYHGFMTVTAPDEDILKRYQTVEDLTNAGFVNDPEALRMAKMVFVEDGTPAVGPTKDEDVDKSFLVEDFVCDKKVDEPESITEEPESVNPMSVEAPIADLVEEKVETKTETTISETEKESVENENSTTKTETPIPTPESEHEKVNELVGETPTPVPEPEPENEPKPEPTLETETPAEDPKPKTKKTTTKKSTKKES